ncbi:type I-E CRISPR-associated protein Cse2/CasB [Micromonospora sp. NPDC050397]|uniref:type I-E CRISPR-associated protein Cse2/CasB n=1 Tax=Micromonospora sp. NPDC050397 TaxID=3364279 RepID=UPI0038510805
MTAVAPPDSEPTATDPSPRYIRRRRPFGSHVAATVDVLQGHYRRKQPAAVATMAQLRAAVGRLPGSEYQILQLTQVPDRYQPDRYGDDATEVEQAKHTALTLYALHQQSIQDAPMHIDGPGLGASISLLTKASGSAEAVRRRFAAIGTASTYTEVTHHLRTFVRLLRDHRIALDYGLLADDLVAVQRPGGRARVRAQWGRDFYRVAPDTTDDPDTPTTAVPVNADTEE